MSASETKPLSPDVESQPIPEDRGADGMPIMAAPTAGEDSLLKTVLTANGLLTGRFSPLPVVLDANPLAWYNSMTFKMLWTFLVAVAYHNYLAKSLGDVDGDTPSKFVFLTAILFSRLVLELNFYPMKFKSQIMGAHGNLRTNMTIYKAMDAEGKESGSAITMVSDGLIGQFNRANRSLTHFTEFAPALAVLLGVTSTVYPAGAFILAALYAYGRVLHQTGEAESYGNHGLGFGITMNVQFLLEGLCWVGALKGFGFTALGLGEQGDIDLGEAVAANVTHPVVALIVIALFFAWTIFGYPKIKGKVSADRTYGFP